MQYPMRRKYAMAERAHPDDGGFKQGSEYYVQFCQRHELAGHYISNTDCVVDVPCGVGWGSSLLGGRYVHGIDKSPDAIDFAIRRYANDRLSFAIGNMADPCWGASIPFGKADVVVCLDGIEHIHKVEGLIFVSSAWEVLKPQGLLIITTPEQKLVDGRIKTSNPYHLHEYNMGELFDLLLRRGFDVIDNAYKHGVEGKVLFVVGRRHG
jgi:SAM-dependent methyltransferase